MSDSGDIAIVTEHVNGAYGFTMKTGANEFLHRVLPLRDPEQHRFWCVVVVRCTAGGLPDRSQSPWIGQRGLRREELSETMDAIRADLSGWLAQPAQTELRKLVLMPAEFTAPLAPAKEQASVGQSVPFAIATGENQTVAECQPLLESRQASG